MLATANLQVALMESLTTAVRWLSIEQIARHWFDGDRYTTQKMLTQLKEKELITIEQHLVHSSPDIIGPECVWKPEEPAPDFTQVAYRLRSRWHRQKQMTSLAFPTRIACERYGGTRVRPRASELSHDVHFAGVYLHWLAIRDDDTQWVSGDLLRAEGTIATFGGNVPDAVLMNGRGRIEKIVEGGGRYARGKLEQLHEIYREYCYEIW